MSTSRSRIPGSIPPFAVYLETTVAYMAAGSPETNSERLGILEAEQEAWANFLTEWNKSYPLYENRENSRTILVTRSLNTTIRNVKDYDKEHHILDRIAASPNVTIEDLTTFNIKSGPLAKKNNSKPNTPIEALVVPDIQQIGGGELTIKCRNTENTRTAVVDGANCVQYRYKVGGEQPASMNDPILLEGTSTRASFTLNLGGENKGEMAYLYFRWFNNKYPALAGPWSSRIQVLIV